ncbi:uncharacterized protein LOC135672831 isoform X2 [Musa acuminata AAA Group]|uniref:uncharacterized protein LOC135672831 isoform X2 n=1 Tax=Musa acuminata AAA Group TaxID=214697 RepID=UPI0031D4BB61
MRAYGLDPRRDASGGRRDQLPPTPWLPPMESGGGGAGGVRNMTDRFFRLGLGAVPNGNLHQVMMAVEGAENTIKKQLEENNQLKNELLRKTRELERDVGTLIHISFQVYHPKSLLRSNATSLKPSEVSTNDHVEGYEPHHSNSSSGNEAERNKWMDNHSSLNSQGILLIHQNGFSGREEPFVETSTNNQQLGSNKVNGDLKKIPLVRFGVEGAGPSQDSTPSSRSISPSKNQKDGEHDKRFNSSGNGLLRVSDTSPNILWKQELIVKVRKHEEEIAQLRKHLTDYLVKETHICNDKYVLDKHIAYMRTAFDQQQQDLVNAASKAISYRQDIIEENILLSHALQAAHAERSTFVSSLVPLLSEHGLQPSIIDAQSIVSNLKVLFGHMHEKLIISKEKLKESQYQIAPWYAESSHNAGFPTQSPSRPLSSQVAVSNKNNLEIVPQPANPHAQTPISSSNFQTRLYWEAVGGQNQQFNQSSVPTKSLDQDTAEIYTPVRRDPVHNDASAQTNLDVTHVALLESKSQRPSFKHLVKSGKTDDPEMVALQHGKEHSVHWAPGNSYLPSGQDVQNSYSYLPTVYEEPSSSFSEDDDPLPAINSLRISGEAYPGRELQASGYSINGTTSCNFEWVRYLEDGSVNYIDGARQPSYLVTADDVDSYLAIEVHPLDDRKRKGELVKVFANEQRKIICDPEMQEQIKRTLSVGLASYEISLSAKFLDIWEPAVLAIKREGYSIKCKGPRGIVVMEKFQPNTTILIPYGHPTEFLIQDASGDSLLKTEASSVVRDTIVLTMRLFKAMAGEKKKGRKRGLFFK